MTLYQFRLLSPEVQLRYVLREGAYLAQRWEGALRGVNLCYCDDGGGPVEDAAVPQSVPLKR